MTILEKYTLVIFVSLLPFLFGGCEQGESTGVAKEAQTPQLPTITVYKTPTCGCCAEWVSHLESAGFPLEVEDKDSLDSLKTGLGVPPEQRSCHTGVTKAGDYFFEGHIPAHVIKTFLQNPPENAIGLSVPGMPIGSPGMEVDDRFVPYSVYQINRDGSAIEFAKVDSQASQYQ